MGSVPGPMFRTCSVPYANYDPCCTNLLHRCFSACSTGEARRPRGASTHCSRWGSIDHRSVPPDRLLCTFQRRVAHGRLSSSYNQPCCRPANAIRLLGMAVCKCSEGRCEMRYCRSCRRGKLNEVRWKCFFNILELKVQFLNLTR